MKIAGSLALASCGMLAIAASPEPTAPGVGLSHVPIAVGNLSQAASDFERLGFALKTGRAHDDGIMNRHVKFTDGTEVELITATSATDALTGYYRRFLAAGDGAAFLSLYPDSMDDAAGRLAAAGLPVHRTGGYLDFPYEHALGYVFFAGLNQSPTDRPEHFAHANSAFTLEGVSLEGGSLAPEQQLFKALGLRPAACGDDPAPTSSCVQLSRRQWIRMSSLPRTPSARPIAGVTLAVRSLASVVDTLGRERIAFRRARGADWSGVVVEGPVAHGVRLEFREHSQAGRE
jgi:glyoxalase-like protein